jgi:small GTP-binding protein
MPKIIIIGASGSGKTSLVLCYQNDCNGFSNLNPNAYLATVGGRFYLAEINGVNWQIVDTTGAQGFKRSLPDLFRQVNAVVICVDLFDKKKVLELKTKIAEVNRLRNGQPVKIFVAGTRSDLCSEENLTIAEDAVKTRCSLSGIPCDNFFTTSAKTGEGVKKLFSKVFESFIPKYTKEDLIRRYCEKTSFLTSLTKWKLRFFSCEKKEEDVVELFRQHARRRIVGASRQVLDEYAIRLEQPPMTAPQ